MLIVCKCVMIDLCVISSPQPQFNENVDEKTYISLHACLMCDSWLCACEGLSYVYIPVLVCEHECVCVCMYIYIYIYICMRMIE